MFKKSLAALAVLGAAAGYASAADVTLFGVVDTGLISSGNGGNWRNTQMFKKSLAALAVLGAAAGYASAADVTLFGVVDTGLIYTHQTFGDAEPAHVNKFAMESGVSSASRFGLKGTEELGNGLKVGFMLENGFQSDSGALKSEKRIFDREASVSVYSDFGTLSMGRMGGVGSGAGSMGRMGGVGSGAGTYDLVLATADAFDGGDNNVFGFATSDRYDNMVTYQTPKFAGLQATVQYSFNEDSVEETAREGSSAVNRYSSAALTGDFGALQTPKFAGLQATVQYSFNEDSVEETAREGSSAVNRYSSAALTGDFGALQTVLAYEFQNYKSFGAAEHDDGQIVYLGGNYDCGFAKTFVMGQYFKGIKAGQLTAITEDDAAHIDTVGTDDTDDYSADGVKGYGLHLGTIVPVAGGDLTVAAYFTDFAVEYADQDVDAKSYAFGAKYEYYLSKRTSVYTGAGFAQVKYDDEGSDKTTQAYLGLTHRF